MNIFFFLFRVSIKRISLFDNLKPEHKDEELRNEIYKAARTLKRECQEHGNILKLVGDDYIFESFYLGEPFVCIVTEYCEVSFRYQNCLIYLLA